MFHGGKRRKQAEGLLGTLPPTTALAPLRGVLLHPLSGRRAGEGCARRDRGARSEKFL